MKRKNIESKKGMVNFELGLLKDGLVYCLKGLFYILVFVGIVIGSFVLVMNCAITFHITALKNEAGIMIAIVTAGVVYKITFPWLRKLLWKIFTYKEREESIRKD